MSGGSKGPGAAAALLFAQAGARIVVTFGNDVEAADQLIASLPGIGHRASHDTRTSRAHILISSGCISSAPQAPSTEYWQPQ